MPDHEKFYEEETREISRLGMIAWGSLGAGLLAIVGGWVSVGKAGPADINLIAGGYTAIGTGCILATIGLFAARDHAKLMEHNRRRHHIMLEVTRRQHAEVCGRLVAVERRLGQIEDAQGRQLDSIVVGLRNELALRRQSG